jgi:hypothetical protein
MCPIFTTLGPPVDTKPEPDVITHFRFRHAPHHFRPGHAPKQQPHASFTANNASNFVIIPSIFAQW